MSTSAAHANAFFDEVLRERQVWTIRDEAGFPAPAAVDGARSMPFWSLASRAGKVVSSIAAYGGFEIVVIPLDDWRSKWLPGLERDGLLLGLNWSGPRATGFDIEPSSALASLAAREAAADASEQ